MCSDFAGGGYGYLRFSTSHINVGLGDEPSSPRSTSKGMVGTSPCFPDSKLRWASHSKTNLSLSLQVQQPNSLVPNTQTIPCRRPRSCAAQATQARRCLQGLPHSFQSLCPEILTMSQTGSVRIDSFFSTRQESNSSSDASDDGYLPQHSRYAPLHWSSDQSRRQTVLHESESARRDTNCNKTAHQFLT